LAHFCEASPEALRERQISLLVIRPRFTLGIDASEEFLHLIY
jgi:hypothetical protein